MGTTCTLIPICLRSAWIRVAICLRCALLALARMENSTGWPAESISVPSAFQRNPALRRRSFAFASDRSGLGREASDHNLLPGVTCAISGVARPWYTSFTIASRSMASEIA